MMYMYQSSSINEYVSSTYSNAYEDREPVLHIISPEDAEKHKMSVTFYGDGMSQAFVPVSKNGKRFGWISIHVSPTLFSSIL